MAILPRDKAISKALKGIKSNFQDINWVTTRWIFGLKAALLSAESPEWRPGATPRDHQIRALSLTVASRMNGRALQNPRPLEDSLDGAVMPSGTPAARGSALLQRPANLPQAIGGLVKLYYLPDDGLFPRHFKKQCRCIRVGCPSERAAVRHAATVGLVAEHGL